MEICVIGAGLSGLAAALELSKDNNIILLEKENYLGGMASSYKIKWDKKIYRISKTYHHILKGDETTIDFIKKFGLYSKFHKKKVKQGFIYRHRIHGFSTPLEILKFPISLIDKIKLAKLILFSSKNENWNNLKNVSAKEWIIKKAGRKNYDVFFKRLIYNKFHESGEKISAPWFGTRFFKESSSFMGKMGWLEGGIESLIEGFVDRILRNGAIIEKNVNIESIQNTKEGCRIIYKRNNVKKRLIVDKVISTIPPENFIRIAEGISENTRRELKKIKYLSAICLAVGTKKNFDACYWNNVLDKDMPFSVVFKHSALYEDSSPQGKSIFFLNTYLKSNESLWKKSDKYIVNLYLKSINKVIHNFSKHVEWYRLYRLKYAEAIYSLDFKNPPIKDGNIYFAGIYRIYPKIRNMASAIESGIEAARALMSSS